MSVSRISASGDSMVEGAHYIGGFGRIVDLKPEHLLVDTTAAEKLLAAEAEILEHMNEDHTDAVELYATALKDARPGPWRMARHRSGGLRSLA